MNDLDLYVGVSAGAAAASLVANGVTPREILETNLSGTRPHYFDHRNVFRPLSERTQDRLARHPARWFHCSSSMYVIIAK